jgi:hypothetical protein
VHQGAEPGRVDVERVDDQHVAGVPAEQDAVTEALAQARDVRLEGVPRLSGRFLAPDLVDQRVGRHDLVRAHEQVREDGALLGAPQGHRTVTRVDLQRPEHAELHPATVARVTGVSQDRILPRAAQDSRKAR